MTSVLLASRNACIHSTALQFSKALVETYRTYTSCGNATNIRPAAFVDIRLPKDRCVFTLNFIMYIKIVVCYKQ